MAIKLMQTSDGGQHYAFGIDLIVSLSEMRTVLREDAIAEEASMYVSEHEGYNSVEYDRMCEEIEDALSLAVLEYIDTNKELNKPNTTWN